MCAATWPPQAAGKPCWTCCSLNRLCSAASHTLPVHSSLACSAVSVGRHTCSWGQAAPCRLLLQRGPCWARLHDCSPWQICSSTPPMPWAPLQQWHGWQPCWRRVVEPPCPWRTTHYSSRACQPCWPAMQLTQRLHRSGLQDSCRLGNLQPGGSASSWCSMLQKQVGTVLSALATRRKPLLMQQYMLCACRQCHSAGGAAGCKAAEAGSAASPGGCCGCRACSRHCSRPCPADCQLQAPDYSDGREGPGRDLPAGW